MTSKQHSMADEIKRELNSWMPSDRVGGVLTLVQERWLFEQLEALVGVAGGVIWLDNNIHNYGSDEWRGYFKAVLRDVSAVSCLTSDPQGTCR